MALDLKNVPKDVLVVADYLRSSESQLKIRSGVLNGRRVDFFKGKHAVNALLREPYKKNASRPSIPDRATGESFCAKLNDHSFFLKVDKPPKQKNLALVPTQGFSPDAYYAWVYEGSTWKNSLIGVGVLLITLAGVMFPLWPAPMRVGVYYLSLGLLGLMGVFMVLVLFRFLLWIVLKLATGRDGWLFPNLFADVGIVDSFIPTWGWEEKKSKKKKRIGSDGDGDGTAGSGIADDE
ncbi:Translocation protein S62 [Borealophlyctis nickersoniae]|nr:Translocation protein S62 [Borealophlyctis nickersoniae]